MLSVTDLTTYTYCARKLYLSRVLKLSEPVKDVMVLGSIKHKLLEILPVHHHNMALQLKPDTQGQEFINEYIRLSLAALSDIIIKYKYALKQTSTPLDHAFSHVKELAVTEAQTRAENLLATAQQTNKWSQDLWDAYFPKEKAEYSLESEQLFLRGRIDALHIHQNKIVPVEHKSGEMPPQGVWDSHRLQLTAYALLLEEHFQTPIPYGVVNYFDAHKQREVHLNPFSKDEIRALIPTVRKTLSQKEVPPIVDNPAKCKTCGFFNYCEKELKAAGQA
ncbi:CRISPR-associated protein Cas4 [Candidatus Woesearchaeota archaeon]|nr:CRISPR-associated protein Cas4 [Candidatus Woesearchaeota archaeon]